jgi:predicted fused transcriptional regulator/phosphomethylpyrimidine kinase
MLKSLRLVKIVKIGLAEVPLLRKNLKKSFRVKWSNEKSYFMRNITKVKIKVNDIIYDQIKGIAQGAEAIIRAFGEHALKIYGLT